MAGLGPSEGSQGASVLISLKLWWRPATPGAPWLVDTSLQSPPPPSVLCMCTFMSLFLKDTVTRDKGPSSTSTTSSHLGYICKDPISKHSPIHRYWGLGRGHIF